MTSLKYNEREYEACDWFLNIQTQRSVSELQSDLFVSNSGFLVDNRTQRFIERYFNAFYLVDVGGEFENDICILRHSNTLNAVVASPILTFTSAPDPPRSSVTLHK
ncbi:unnamed protein product [Schistosoma curassoni]|uniref:Uncharacterized protein n=1 Tax=Schistosoma curassoni TaxID=6186 RepID=A0A183JF23_9TREM|nr:unnamed protein product [Schistosoma curassoni]